MKTIQLKDSYENAVLERWQNFGLSYGTANQWVFGKVVNYEDSNIIFDRYNSLDAGKSDASIGTGDALTWNTWETTSDYEIFYERTHDIVLQSFIGIKPARLRLFRALPDITIRGNLDKIHVSSITEDSPGFIDGRDSPYETPGYKSEMIVPPMMHVNFALYNPENYTVSPVFNIKIRRMLVRWYDIDNSADKKMIDSFVDGKIPCHFWSPGLTPSQYDFGIINVQPTEVVLPKKFAGKGS